MRTKRSILVVSVWLGISLFEMACGGTPASYVRERRPVKMYHEGRAHVQEVEGLKVKIGGGREHRLVRMVLRQGPNQTYISQYEVTQEEWDTVLEKKPAMRNGALPVEPSDERLIREFLAKMKKRTGFESRLPTREEWTSMSSAAMAWPELDVSGNPLSRFLLLRGKGGDIERAPWPVGGSGLADELGCFDVVGNVAERVSGESGTWYACGGSYAQSWSRFKEVGPCVEYSSVVLGLGGVGFRMVMEIEGPRS